MKSKPKKKSLLWRTALQIYKNRRYEHLDYLTAYEHDDKNITLRIPVVPNSSASKLEQLATGVECRFRLIISANENDSIPSVDDASLVLVIIGILASSEIRLHPDDHGLWTHEIIISNADTIDTQEERPLTRRRNPEAHADR